MRTLSALVYSLAAIAVAYIAVDGYLQANAETQNAMNVRAQYAEREAYYAAQRTQTLVSLFTEKSGPIQEFGCPVAGGVFLKTKHGKKRVC
jgi:hypothetical protein